MIRTPNEPDSGIPTNLGKPTQPPAPPAPAPAPAPTGTPGIYRKPDGKLVTDLPIAFGIEPGGADETAEEELPYQFHREADGRLMYRCPRCDREAEYFGPDDIDPTWPCGGSMFCLP